MLEANDWRRTQLHMEGAVNGKCDEVMLDIFRGSVLETLKLFDQQPLKWDNMQMTFPNSSINSDIFVLLTWQPKISDTSLGCEPFVSTSSHQFQFQTVPSWSRRLKPRLKRCKGLKRSRWLSHWEWYKFNDEEKTPWKNVEKAWKLPWPQQVSWNFFGMCRKYGLGVGMIFFWDTSTCDCPEY